MEAARWVVGKALSPASGAVLEAWAASTELGANIRALRMELLYAQGMLNNAHGREHGREEIKNRALTELLQELQDLAYSADDALDEVDYFRIQDELDGTFKAADEHAGGFLRNHASNAGHAVKGIAKSLGFSSCARSASRGDRDEPNEEKRGVPCGAWPCRGVLCGVAWPCAGQTTHQIKSSHPQSNQANQEEVHSGCMQKISSSARNTISIVGKHLPCYSSPVQNDPNSNMASSGRLFFGCARPNKAPQREDSIIAPKLKFNRVEMSKKMKEITKQLKPVCAKVSTILNLELLDSNRSIAQCIATGLDKMINKNQGYYTPLPTNSAATMSRPITTAEPMESTFYGRDNETSKIIHDITKGDYRDKDLTVLPIVGPGGIGKTTLTRHIYKKLEQHFVEKIWVCVSTTFSVYRLTQEIANNLAEGKTGSPDKLIEEKLKSKKFLLVLDDMWSCGDEEWKRFLVPFKKGQNKGNMILVTTRFPSLAQRVKETADRWINLEGLDPKAFKDLFLACIFGDKQSTNDHGKLLEIGDEILKKLKGSPLAAKTVGRLLGKHLDFDHWNRVLENKEWETENGKDDIMPALRLSYDYLPFHLQQCFSYCALFPEDYKFEVEELIHLWISLDLLNSHGRNIRIEEIGGDHLTELVGYGFFRKEEDRGRTLFVIHDLLHELALKVSSHECLSIYSHNVRCIQIQPLIRHLSINIDDTSVKDRMTLNTCQKDLIALVKRLKVENLRSLMLFGQHQGSFVKTLAGSFKEAKGLRVVLLSKESYNVTDLLHDFSNCVHIRYLRSYYQKRLPDVISRLYHLRVLDVGKWYYPHDSTTIHMSNLIKLRHFLVPDDKMHTCIFKVGKLRSLQELKRFVVKKESRGFELSQIGHLELCGSLRIDNLGMVEKEEADEAKLTEKTHLRKLALHWDSDGSNKDPAEEDKVLESLKPSDNLVELCITGHGGATFPSWLGANFSVKNLECLRLEDVSWKNLPPLGELLVDEQDKECYQRYVEGQHFTNLKMLELVKIPKLKKWIGNGPCELFSHLEELTIEDCPELMELPYAHHNGCVPEHEDHMTWFPRLEKLRIARCPKLSSLPCIPWSSSTRSAKIVQVGSGLDSLDYTAYHDFGYLRIGGKDALDDGFWNVVAFRNLPHLPSLSVTRCPPLSLDHLQVLSSLKTLRIYDSGDAVWFPEGDGCVGYQCSAEDVTIEQCGGSGERLTRLFSCFPNLRSLSVGKCEKLTGLGVVDQKKQQQAPAQLSSSIDEVDAAQIGQREQQQGTRGEEEIVAAAAEELLLLSPQLESLVIEDCPNLVLCCPDSLASDRDTGRTGGGGGLQGLRSLRILRIFHCPRFLSSYSSSSSSPCFPFPTSLERLSLADVDGMQTLLLLSNLTSLADLYIWGCRDLRCEGLRHLLVQGRLAKLTVRKTLNFFADFEPSPPHEQELPSSSSKLQELWTDDVASVLAGPICALLSSSLTKLNFLGYKEGERFTKEQEEALQLLTSLERIEFWSCDKLKCLPAGLHRLPNLKILGIDNCAAIRSLPKDGLPSSLQELEICYCPAIRSMPKEYLPNSLQKLVIEYCPAIKSLPKVGDLPSSLRELDVRHSSKELRSQCRKLIGTIPIVRVD